MAEGFICLVIPGADFHLLRERFEISKMSNLSVVLPTLNCVPMLPAHLESMAAWLDLADEIIVVDSDSDDGTTEMIRERLKHPNLRILSHPRGLYQSWNHGIRQTTGRWIYISTVGDLIERHQLLHLMSCGEEHGADVVCSPPAFVMSNPAPMHFKPWPITRIIHDGKLAGPRIIPSLEVFIQALVQIPNAVLGSSGSNLYRGTHLREHPFPVEFGVCGDTGWAFLHGLEARFCYTPRVGSIFVFHDKPQQPLDAPRVGKICSDLRAAAGETVSGNSSMFPADVLKCVREYLELRDRGATLCQEAADKLGEYEVLLAEWKVRKRKAPPWYLTARGWWTRGERKRQLREWRQTSKRARKAEEEVDRCEARLNELLGQLRDRPQ
jgi:hypothetical protein